MLPNVTTSEVGCTISTVLFRAGVSMLRKSQSNLQLEWGVSIRRSVTQNMRKKITAVHLNCADLQLVAVYFFDIFIIYICK